MNLLNNISRNIYDLDKKSMAKAEDNLKKLIYPFGTLGKLEEICVQLAGIYETDKLKKNKAVVLTFAADHGVYEEGISTQDQKLTWYQTENFVNGKACIASICNSVGADIVTIDIGINSDKKISGVIDAKIKRGTKNITKGPAMSFEDAVKSIEIGIENAEMSIVKGYDIVCIGEMGIGNTTPSTAIISVMSGIEPSKLTDKGACLPENKISHKAKVISKAIEVNNPNPTDGIEVLAKVGGFEIGAMVGVILGCSANRVPIIIDGYISYAAALIAYKINPKIKNYIIASHISNQCGSEIAINMLKLNPILNVNFGLGEGTGAALVIPFINCAIDLYNNVGKMDEEKIGEVLKRKFE